MSIYFRQAAHFTLDASVYLFLLSITDGQRDSIATNPVTPRPAAVDAPRSGPPDLPARRDAFPRRLRAPTAETSQKATVGPLIPAGGVFEMYSVVLMMAMTGTPDAAAFGHRMAGAAAAATAATAAAAAATGCYGCSGCNGGCGGCSARTPRRARLLRLRGGCYGGCYGRCYGGCCGGCTRLLRLHGLLRLLRRLLGCYGGT